MKKTSIKVLEKPYTNKEILEKVDEDGWIEGYIVIEMSDMIDNDLEGFLDLLGEMLIGNCCMMQPNYTPVGVDENNRIILKVEGDVNFLLDDIKEELEEDND
jgi:hypothetical protein